MASNPDPAKRIASLDQFRGYTVLGMFVVNFAGGFLALPETIRHSHTHFSYADSIMPQFFLAVGFALRMTLLSRWRAAGPRAAYGRALSRVAALMLVAFVVHGVTGKVASWQDLSGRGVTGFLATAFQRQPFETLGHIAVTSLWVLPVIAAGPLARVAYMAASAALFWHLSVQHGYYTFAVTRPVIDGGPLGFLTWTTPVLAGSLAFDVVASGKSVVPRLLRWAAAMMAVGYGISCLSRILDPESPSALAPPPFVAPDEPTKEYHERSKRPENARHLFWVMSQRSGSPSYLAFGAGFALAVYAAFVLVCDVAGRRSSVLATLGANALAAYIVHGMLDRAMSGYAPKDAPLWFALGAFAVFFGVCYAILRYMERHRLFLRL